MTVDFGKSLEVQETEIPGLFIIDLCVHGDSRGWFKENWQKQKLESLGLPSFWPVQNNISFNESRGVTRGIHAEPWDKYISVANGSVFGAWVDLRGGEGFGKVVTAIIDETKAVYVPRGVGNAFQSLEDGTAYTYLVNDHWSPELKSEYTFVNLGDPSLGIEWPIPLSSCELSKADKVHPRLTEIQPMKPKRTLVLGRNGQLGRALVKLVADSQSNKSFDFADREIVDLSDEKSLEKINWSEYGTVINCAAFTLVDYAEEEGLREAWNVNASGVARLARICAEKNLTLVHVSSDYVFLGDESSHSEDEPLSPRGVYGASKAAGDLAVSVCPRHYILRTSWVVGDGKNFVNTMVELSDAEANANNDGTTYEVVDDQFGRLTFANDLARAILELLKADAPYGIYNFSNSGPVASWFEIARRIFDLRNDNSDAVFPISTSQYVSKRDHVIAPRPRNSALSLAKISRYIGEPPGWESSLEEFLKKSST